MQKLEHYSYTKIMMEVGNGASSASPSVDASRLAPSNSSPSKDKESLSHVEVIEKSKEGISRLLSDPFLSDLSKDISLDEVKSVLALEQGKAITLHLRRFDDEVLCMWGNKYSINRDLGVSPMTPSCHITNSFCVAFLFSLPSSFTLFQHSSYIYQFLPSLALYVRNASFYSHSNTHTHTHMHTHTSHHRDARLNGA